METKVKSKVLQQFQEATETIVNPELKKWLDQGGKVMGYFCSYGPEEIITAAGMVPIRMRAIGSTGTEMADTYMSNINCSFCRHSSAATASTWDLQASTILLKGLSG